MTVREALQMLDEAVPSLMDKESVVYPGLNAIEAMNWVVRGFLESIKDKTPDQIEMLQVHPQVEARMRQIAKNVIGVGPAPDNSIAALYRMSYPPNPEVPAGAPVWTVLKPEEAPTVDADHAPQKRYSRKFL